MARHGDLDPLKASAIRAFIARAFPPPEYAVTESYDADRSAQIFRISRGTAVAHIFGVSREFVADHSIGEIEVPRAEQATEFIQAPRARSYVDAHERRHCGQAMIAAIYVDAWLRRQLEGLGKERL